MIPDISAPPQGQVVLQLNRSVGRRRIELGYAQRLLRLARCRTSGQNEQDHGQSASRNRDCSTDPPGGPKLCRPTPLPAARPAALHCRTLAVPALIVGPFGARLVLRFLATRRRAKFAEQLDETLQLLAGGLRAGHSLLRAIDAVAGESEAPTSEEFSRIINETRLGRDLGEALDDAALRMRSEDFSWVAQAIAIHREVGGNLADVLDQVGHTIRERNQIRGQVRALSAEGKISALVLMVLPFALGGVLLVISPGYMDPLVENPLGLVMIAVSVVLLILGGLWLRKVVSFHF